MPRRKQLKKVSETTVLPTGLSLVGYNRTAFTLRGHRVIVAAKLVVAARESYDVDSPAMDSALSHLTQMVAELESAEEAASRRPDGPLVPERKTEKKAGPPASTDDPALVNA